MEQLHEYLQTLLSTASYELHLEPNRNPYVVSASGETDVSDTPLIGTQISMMVFPLIPPDVKQELPDQPQIEFVHPHNLGKFNFIVRKSPNGFNVTVYPIYGEIIKSELDADTTDNDVNGSFAETCAQEFNAVQFDVDGSESAAESSMDASAFEVLSPTENPGYEHADIPGFDQTCRAEESNSFDDASGSSLSEQKKTIDAAVEFAPIGINDEEAAVVHSKPIGDDLAFSICFARFFTTEIHQNSSVKKPLSVTQRGWAYSVMAALTQTAKVFAFGCRFEGDEKSTAVIENHSRTTRNAIIAKWVWNHEDIFDEGNLLETLRTSCAENANAAAFLLTFCVAADYDSRLQKTAEFWSSAFHESQYPPALYLHTIVFEQGDDMRKLERLRSVEIDIDYVTVLNDLSF